MGTLAAALAWAARGFRIFPIEEDSKMPRKDSTWTADATTDANTIKTLWIDPVTGVERDWNIGFLTTGWIVADVDVKDNKPGLDTFAELGLEFDTLTTRSPSGGYHLIYRGLEDRLTGQSPLGEGVDVRSHNGYVLAPGSSVGGKSYLVEIDQPVAPFPAHLRDRLKAPKTRVAAADSFDDRPEMIEHAAHWLAYEARPAVQGQRGHDTAYAAGLRCWDLGLSESTAYDVMLDEYNPRCAPPFSPEELMSIVTHVYRYAKGQAGGMAPAAIFGDVQPVEMPRVNGAAVPSSLFRYGRIVDAAHIIPRPWVFEGLLLRRAVTLLVAEGGAGKSLLSLIIAAHLAVGLDFSSMKVVQPGKSIVYNAEDDVDEVSRRMNAICEAYNIDKAAVNEKVCLLGADDLILQFTEGRPPRVNSEQVQMFITAAQDPEVVFVAIDPMIEAHSGEENDNNDMRYVMGVFRLIARRADVAVMLVHHTGKIPIASSQSYAGNQHAGRGASSTGFAGRIMLTLFPVSEADCEGIGVVPAEKHNYVRLDGAKGNYMGKTGRPHWLRWHEREIANGERIGVLLPHDAKGAHDAMVKAIAGLISETMIRNGSAVLTMDEAVDELRASDMLFAKEEPATAKKRLVRLFDKAVTAPNGVSINLSREGGARFIVG